MQRFFVEGPLAVGATVQVDSLAPQLAQVLRMAAGDEIVLLDGSGDEFRGRIVQLDRRAVRVEILAGGRCAAEPPGQLTLYQCSLKQDKFEWVLQKGTELGVSRFVPVISARSIVRPAGALLRKYERWQAIVREAAEQCGRGRVPEIALPQAWAEAVAGAKGLRLLPWEGAMGASPLAAVLQENLPGSEAVAIAIGPEGGIEDGEAEMAAASGWQWVSLGPRILRAETAAVAAVAVAFSVIEAAASV
jgi:16S rRNA (uracil1498-N3)-methyltransferase